jgi:chromosome segregation ATPase
MIEKIEYLSREYVEINEKLEHCEAMVEDRNKEKQLLSEELAEKDKEIVDLRDYVEELKETVNKLEQSLGR